MKCKKINIMVLGAAGMAGHVIATYMTEHGYNVYSVARSLKSSDRNRSIDISNLNSLELWLDEIQPSVIINCIGLLQKACEHRPDLAIFINSYFPHWLEQKYRNEKTKIIHLSTDCVFSGKRGGYIESDILDGTTMYDRSKALGEIINNKDLTFRMSIIGPDCNKNGTGLFHWFMYQTDTVSGFRKAIWNGVTTIELSRAIDEAIKQNLTGLYHLTPEKSINKYDLLLLIKKVFKCEIEIHPNDDFIVDKSLVNTRTDFNFIINSYNKQIDEMLIWIKSHNDFYPYQFFSD